MKINLKRLKDRVRARRTPRPVEGVEHVCLNCANRFAGAYCNVCGQPADVERYTRKSLLREINHTIRKIDVLTMLTPAWALIKRPGEFIHGYLAGKRVGHINAVKFYFYSIVADVLVREFLQWATGDSSFNSILLTDTNYQIVGLVSTLLWGVLWKIFYRESGLYAAEFAICALYFGGLTNLLGTLTMILAVPFTESYPSTSLVLPFVDILVAGVYGFYMARQVFGEPWWKTIAKQTVLLVLYLIVLGVMVYGFTVSTRNIRGGRPVAARRQRESELRTAVRVAPDGSPNGRSTVMGL